MVMPDNKYPDYVDIKFTKSLLDIDVVSDRSDPRRLVIFDNKQEQNIELLFPDTQKCSWAFKEITNNKQGCRERYIMLTTKLFTQLSSFN